MTAWPLWILLVVVVAVAAWEVLRAPLVPPDDIMFDRILKNIYEAYHSDDEDEAA